MEGRKDGWMERFKNLRVIEHLDHPLDVALHRVVFAMQGEDVLVYLIMHDRHLVADHIQGLVDLSDCIVNLAGSIEGGRWTIVVRSREVRLHDFMSASCVGGACRIRHAPVGSRWDE